MPLRISIFTGDAILDMTIGYPKYIKELATIFFNIVLHIRKCNLFL